MATPSLPALPAPPGTQSIASGSASASHHVGVTASSSTPESAARPTIATDCVTIQSIVADLDIAKLLSNTLVLQVSTGLSSTHLINALVAETVAGAHCIICCILSAKND
ncbi:hypothetical protein E2562_029276 [Oryza meyeriana var. granulata]|uniref:Uncharacterized protein n=1 Tax=Oryza meyeriana var. granulata TaxID=110450 RepID=A0A6G1BP43_9ORYZ|nr:hypothetical protein E2562_029276 [Oryza meyeriana var. granulata]